MYIFDGSPILQFMLTRYPKYILEASFLTDPLVTWLSKSPVDRSFSTISCKIVIYYAPNYKSHIVQLRKCVSVYIWAVWSTRIPGLVAQAYDPSGGNKVSEVAGDMWLCRKNLGRSILEGSVLRWVSIDLDSKLRTEWPEKFRLVLSYQSSSLNKWR